MISNWAIVLQEGKIKYQGNLKDLTTSQDNFLNNFFSDKFIEEKTESL
jgi:ABC-type transporter Mla maintaining outer membrane lipid asymmetry ATPase subunit MlaF